MSDDATMRAQLQTMTLERDRLLAEKIAFEEAMFLIMGPPGGESIVMIRRVAAGPLNRGGY